MMIEVMILGILLYVILEYNGSISTNKFIIDNQDIFKKLKEKDYDFYAKARYGDSIDVEASLLSYLNLVISTAYFQ